MCWTQDNLRVIKGDLINGILENTSLKNKIRTTWKSNVYEHFLSK